MSTIGPIDKGAMKARLQRIKERVESEIRTVEITNAAKFVRRQNLKGLGELEGSPEHDILKKVKAMMYSHQTSALIEGTANKILNELADESEQVIPIDKTVRIKKHAQDSINLGEASKQGAIELISNYLPDYDSASEPTNEACLALLAKTKVAVANNRDIPDDKKAKLLDKIKRTITYLEEIVFFNGLDSFEKHYYNLIRNECALERSLQDIKIGLEVYDTFEGNIENYTAVVEEFDMGSSDDEGLDLREATGVKLDDDEADWDLSGDESGPSQLSLAAHKVDDDKEPDWDLSDDESEPDPESLKLAAREEESSELDWGSSDEEEAPEPEGLKLAARDEESSGLDWGSSDESESEQDLRVSVERSLTLAESFDRDSLATSVEHMKLGRHPETQSAPAAASAKRGKSFASMADLARKRGGGTERKSSTLDPKNTAGNLPKGKSTKRK